MRYKEGVKRRRGNVNRIGRAVLEMRSEPLSREELIAKIKCGRKFCRASFSERQDYILRLDSETFVPIRDITDERNHWHRESFQWAKVTE